MNEPITILIADDHQLVRQGVRDFLETQGDLTVVGEASNGEEVVDLAEQFVPDVILMDLVMPGRIDGVQATRKVKNISPRTQVVVLTSYHEDEHIFPAIRAGADVGGGRRGASRPGRSPVLQGRPAGRGQASR